MRILKALKYDILFQFRHGFYFAYGVVTLLYIIFLNNLPMETREYIIPIIIFTDTGALGFFFLGGMVLLEKDQKSLEALFVTPMRISEYLVTRVLSLLLLSVSTSIIILLTSYGFSANIFMFLIGTVLTSILFTLLGFPWVARAKSVNIYLLGAVLVMWPFILPLLDYLNIVKTPLFMALPTTGSLNLLQGSFNTLDPMMLVYSIGILAVWIGIAFVWAKKWFAKYIILSIGDEK